MKIKFKDINREELETLKNNLEEIMSMDFNEMELTEENLKKAKCIKDKVNSLRRFQYNFSGTEIIIVSTDGTELTRMY